MTTIAIIGGGPVGLEAALLARLNGLNVDLYERGGVAQNVRDWGHVCLFSPFEMNSSAWGRQALKEATDDDLPQDDEYLSGQEFAERYLQPLSRLPELAGVVHEQTTVLGVSRDGLWKGDQIGQATRGDVPFRLLLEAADGCQWDAQADYVLDCSGVYGHHNQIGAGGLTAVGERGLAAEIEYGLPDVLGAQREHYANRATLVIGSGYSAATTVTALAELAESSESTRIIWLTRSRCGTPIAEIEEDPLPERRRLTQSANQLAMAGEGPLRFLPGYLVTSVASAGQEQGGYRVMIRQGAVEEELAVDRIVANVGYQPDRSLYQELQIHECYASSGPMKLAAALLGESGGDCLQMSAGGIDQLRNPEPGFFILGAKSYGRDSRFLLRTGLEQIEQVVSAIKSECGAPAENAFARQGGGS